MLRMSTDMNSNEVDGMNAEATPVEPGRAKAHSGRDLDLSRGRPNWSSIDDRLPGAFKRSFVSGIGTEERIRVHYFRCIEDGSLGAKVWFGPGSLGPPGHAHGGSIAAILDEAMGLAAWMRGHKVVAVRLVTEFCSMVPLGTVALLEASVAKVDGRKVETAGRILSLSEEILAVARGLFVTLDPERLETLASLVSAEDGGGSAQALELRDLLEIRDGETV